MNILLNFAGIGQFVVFTSTARFRCPGILYRLRGVIITLVARHIEAFDEQVAQILLDLCKRSRISETKQLSESRPSQWG